MYIQVHKKFQNTRSLNKILLKIFNQVKIIKILFILNDEIDQLIKKIGKLNYSNILKDPFSSFYK
jgi:hypothetical protein